jgi:histidine triad (HIT) family protein
MSDPSCIFCKIAAGQVPCYKVFEDDQTLAFLDVGPLAEGHLLVIPKEHYERLDQMPPELAGTVMAHLPRLARGVTQLTGAPGFNVLQNNHNLAQQSVAHVHFPIIPRREGDGLGYRWLSSKYPPGRADELRDRLIQALQG